MQQPLSPPRIIERPFLRNLLLESLEKSHVLLTAPGGYGKSMALRDLARHHPQAQLVTITQADLDLSVLKTRLTPLLDSSKLIMLDDVHLLTGGAEVCTWLQQQLQQQQTRWLLSGRALPFDPQLLLLSGQVTRFNRETLAFSLAETAVLLAQSETTVQTLHQRLEGWSLAISLLSRLPQTDNPLPATETHLFTYLTHAVFAQLPAQLKQFMQVTAVPLAFNHDLIAHLWGDEAEAKTLFAEIKRADLYLQPTDKADWFRYHDLIRDYLLQDFAERETIAETAVYWLQEQGMAHKAVDQALDAGLNRLAAKLIAQIPLNHFHRNGTYLTYRRWVSALDDDALSVDLMLLLRLANVSQLMPGYKEEARQQTTHTIQLATEQGNSRVRLMAQCNLALGHYQQGELATARELVLAVLDDPECLDYPQLFALRIATLVLTDSGHYHDVLAYFTKAIALANDRQAQNEPFMNQANMAAMYCLPLGKIEEAEKLLTAVLAHFADAPGWTAQYLTYWCELQTAKGDWAELASGLAQLAATIEKVLEETTDLAIHTKIWHTHYQTIQAIVQGDDARVQTTLATYASLVEYYALSQDCLNWLACWHLRRRGDWAAVQQRAAQALAQPTQFANYRALIALECDIAQGMQLLAGDRDNFALHTETKQFVRWRSRHQLLRLRALLAVVCWQQGSWRWRRHWTAVLRQLQKPTLTHQLTQRDPELGVQFWRIGLAAEIDVAQATTALIQIGQIEPLLPLLAHQQTAVRRQTAHILAEIGDERAMVALTAVLSKEKDQPTKTTFERAIQQLERQPPPPLKIKLMGNFVMWRGNEPIQEESWHRPIVLRLFQYFAVHAGQPLSKEKILDDLWPDSDPAKAWGTFRSVYSRLRKLLEPYMRPKATNRYITLTGDTYTFDLENKVTIDFLQFQTIVTQALQNKTAPTTISPQLIAQLEKYGALLPDLPYAEWLFEPRQRCQDLYIEGCLYLARAFLEQGKNNTAVNWAKQTITAAPWLEEAYQHLMRAYARQGQRSLALKTYEEARSNLQQELNIEPSTTTQQLAQSLRLGKPI